MSSEIQSPPPLPDFRIANLWKASESEEERESEDQEFTYQNPIPENPEVETPNIQTSKITNQENPESKTLNIQTPWNQNILNPDLINQLNLFPNIIINQPLIEPIIEPIQLQPLQLLQQPQQLLSPSQQQLQLQQLPQQHIVAPITYAPITKIKKFISEENDVQADYFIVPQILNQFIRDLYSSILQYICPMHPANFQATVTNAKDFETAKLKANYTQAINLVMNKSSELDSKLKQFKSVAPIILDQLAMAVEDTLKLPSKKSITTMYMDAKVDGQSIKLILNSGSAGSIITKQLMNQLGCWVD
ncbi:hypothetical protein G9A89_018703 [Geosiphon pyriformis]|nr:hypothetical protein G9A89_018703 [Geosiphon pyriformis]